jgi:hypothetical protein
MIRRVRSVFYLLLGSSCLWGTPSCSSTRGTPGQTGSGGSAVGPTGSANGSGAGSPAASSGTPGGSGAADTGGVAPSGETSSASGVASAGSAGGGSLAGSGVGSAGGISSGSASGVIPDGGGGASGGSGSLTSDAAGLTQPTCAKSTPAPNDTGGAQGSRPSECDYPDQSLDFEDSLGYASSTGTIKVTDFGQAFGLYEINNCSPYCYAKNLTVGVDIVGGDNPATLQGEFIVEFPQTGPGLPITNAAMRNSLAWITFDGAAKPPFEIDTQMVVETTTGIVPAVEVKPFFKANGNIPFGPFNVANNYSYGNGCEFKYFPITATSGFPSGLTNVTGMGFRIVAKAAAGQEWHGVVYVDHMYIRDDADADWPAEAGGNSNDYPFGLY